MSSFSCINFCLFMKCLKSFILIYNLVLKVYSMYNFSFKNKKLQKFIKLSNLLGKLYVIAGKYVFVWDFKLRFIGHPDSNDTIISSFTYILNHVSLLIRTATWPVQLVLVMAFGALKAPWPDGIHAFFFFCFSKSAGMLLVLLSKAWLKIYL